MEPFQKNDKVQKLEDECDWYRKEALRLDSFNTAMKKDLKYMKGKLEILGGSRDYHPIVYVFVYILHGVDYAFVSDTEMLGGRSGPGSHLLLPGYSIYA